MHLVKGWTISNRKSCIVNIANQLFIQILPALMIKRCTWSWATLVQLKMKYRVKLIVPSWSLVTDRSLQQQTQENITRIKIFGLDEFVTNISEQINHLSLMRDDHSDQLSQINSSVTNISTRLSHFNRSISNLASSLETQKTEVMSLASRMSLHPKFPCGWYW